MKKRVGLVLLLPVGMFLLILGLFIENHVLSGALVGIGTIISGLWAAGAVPILTRNETTDERSKTDWQDERNTVIREKAAWYTGLVTMVAMSVSALVLALTEHITGACVISGLLLLYSVCIMIFSAYFNKQL